MTSSQQASQGSGEKVNLTKKQWCILLLICSSVSNYSIWQQSYTQFRIFGRGSSFFHLSEVRHGGGLRQHKQLQLPLSLAEHRQQRGRVLALGPANEPHREAGSLQSQREQLLHLSHSNNVDDFAHTPPYQCLTTMSSKSSLSCRLWGSSTSHRSLYICLWGCWWRRWFQIPGNTSSASPKLTIAPLKWSRVFVTLACSCFCWYFKKSGWVFLTFQIPSADWN